MARHIRLHCRHQAGFARLDQFLTALTDVFDGLNTRDHIGITFATATTDTAPGLDAAIDVGGCDDAGPSPAALAAFEAAAPEGMGDDEIAVLFPASLTGGTDSGCAQCPPGRRGVLVSAVAAEMTLPHEIAHLFLGSGHHPSQKNLMFSNPAAIIADPPALTLDQANRLRAGSWVLPVAAQFITVTAMHPLEVALENKVARARAKRAPRTRPARRRKKAAKKRARPRRKAGSKKR